MFIAKSLCQVITLNSFTVCKFFSILFSIVKCYNVHSIAENCKAGNFGRQKLANSVLKNVLKFGEYYIAENFSKFGE